MCTWHVHLHQAAKQKLEIKLIISYGMSLDSLMEMSTTELNVSGALHSNNY
jgi:hypothetical protein